MYVTIYFIKIYKADAKEAEVVSDSDPHVDMRPPDDMPPDTPPEPSVAREVELFADSENDDDGVSLLVI